MVGVERPAKFHDSKHHSHENHEDKREFHEGTPLFTPQPLPARQRASSRFEISWHLFAAFSQSWATRIVDVLDIEIEFEIPG